jgi:hypothetical protein
MSVKALPQLQDIVEEIDRLIAEMAVLRSQVSALGSPSAQPERSVRGTEYFGMWAEREDMRGLYQGSGWRACAASSGCVHDRQTARHNGAD